MNISRPKKILFLLVFTHPVRIIINWGSQLCCLMLHIVYHHCSVSAVHKMGMQADVQSGNAHCTFVSRDAKPCTYSLMKSTCCSLFHPSSNQLAQLLSFLIQCNACICDVLSSQVAVFKAEQRSCPLWAHCGESTELVCGAQCCDPGYLKRAWISDTAASACCMHLPCASGRCL